ncbi:nucleotidyl transferase AbiEii/AbiGii toxin family protein [Nocardia sp. R7R-8]|uniref:nucleotidyl transferase AbiEii/AbiGii toxin family protein n=1 Tax=Nocardia sp. R7R-8 TaxID=3459304 RepID=UPI00403D59B3
MSSSSRSPHAVRTSITTRTLAGRIERRPIPRLVDTDDFSQETTAQLYPLADQIADKICAMYEIYGAVGTESGRYRDLVDLLLISGFLTIDLSSTVTALEHERALRAIPSLPTTLESPGSTWPARWAATARNSPLAADYHDFDVALAAASCCYSRILSSLPAADHEATWNHERSTWEN